MNNIASFRQQGIQFLYSLVRPQSSNEDAKRREFILNILLLGSMVLAGVTVLTLTVMKLTLLQQGAPYRGTQPENSLVALLLFIGLYLLSRRRLHAVAAYLHLAIYFFIAVYAIYRWGIDLPQALLLFALIIVMSGILVSTRFMLITTTLIAILLIFFGYLQGAQRLHPNLYWKQEALGTDDAVVAAATLLLIMAVSWLSNREIEKSLYRARQSERALRDERNLLEVKVEERTRQLQQTQLEKVRQVYRLAYFGRLASGLFHDLIAPLNVVSLNLEQLSTHGQGATPGDIVNVKALIERAIRGTKSMERFVKAARRQLQGQETREVFSVAQEILEVLEMLVPKARDAQVDLQFKPDEQLFLYGYPVRFNQLVTNLIANAIDAYESIPQEQSRKQLVLVQLRHDATLVHLTVQDWATGIPQEHLAKIFEPFFTTKRGEKGTGIGLALCKEIVEKYFAGTITVESAVGQGTTFHVTLPVRPGAEPL